MFRASKPRPSSKISVLNQSGTPVDIAYEARVSLFTDRLTAVTAHSQSAPNPKPARQSAPSHVMAAGWMLCLACVEAQYWPGCKISVPVARRQLISGIVLDQIAEALEHSGLAPNRLELILSDIGPGALDLPLLRTVWSLRDQGVGLMVRDVGYDGNGLAVLRRVPATSLAFPSRAIAAACECPDEAAFLRALVAAARTLDVVVVASGIETEEHRVTAAALGCMEGEGSLFAGRLLPEGETAHEGNDTCAAESSPSEHRHEHLTVTY